MKRKELAEKVLGVAMLNNINKNNEMVLCNCCGQWFSYNGFNGIIVKRRGMHRPRYYCGFCIKEHQISKSNEKETTK